MLKGIALVILGWLALPVVLWKARRAEYPWWMVTPDDPFIKYEDNPLQPKHFGYNEEKVRKVYKRFGRYWGDVYWLGVRNKVFGLAYSWKPEWLKKLPDYEIIRGALAREKKWWGALYTLDTWQMDDFDLLRLQDATIDTPTVELIEKYECRVIDLRLFGIIIGHRIDNIYHSPPGRKIEHPNMDGRPAFTFRSRKAMKR